MANSKPEVLVWDAITVAGIFIVMSGIGVIGYQGFLWLQNGYWSPLEFRLAWQWVGGSEPSFTWLGAQKIVVAILDGPLSGGIICVGVAAFWIGDVKARAARNLSSPP
ncbi:MAG: hypothetical protein ACREDV_01385 [Methylocella sp.]